MTEKKPVVIRPGRSADVRLLGAIELAAGRLFPASRIPAPEETYPVAALEQAMSAGMLLVAETDETVAGFATCSLQGDRLHLDEVSVHPDFGRRGYGRALVTRVIELAREQGLRGVSLTTFADIPWNGPFYASMGFAQVPDAELDHALSTALAEERRLGMTERIAMIYPIAAAVRIREARAADAEEVAAAESATAETKGLLNALPGEIPVEAYREKIIGLAKHPNGIYLVAESEERLVGHLLLEPMPLSQNRHVCTLTIVVHPGHTEQGVGRRLLEHAIEWATHNNVLEKIELRVRAGNLRAIRLYQRCGFEQEGASRRRLKYAAGDYEDDLMMGLLLQGIDEGAD